MINLNRLYILMGEKCINNKNLCDKANISYNAFYKIKTGKSKPKIDTIGKIAKALDVDIKELLEEV